MKFSLFYEMQISRPTAQSEAQLFHDAVAQVELADRLGYHCVWAVEHHGLYEYSHSSAPETFLAFCAARTQRIRLGHGVTLTPFRYNHPIRIAERIATLDILSQGRVNWGSGKSASLVEQHAFENDVTQLHAQWLEALDMIPRMWRQKVFSYQGTFFNVPPTHVIPKPVQDPHPPMFAACSRPESAAQVGALGIGALNFASGNDVHLARKVSDYRAAFARSEATPTSYAKHEHFACTPVSLCLPDDHAACVAGFQGASFFNRALAAYYFSGIRPVGRLRLAREQLSPEELDAVMSARRTKDSSSMYVIGDPVHCREIVSRYQAVGVDELILVMQTGTVPAALILESIRTFAEQVMPHFA